MSGRKAEPMRWGYSSREDKRMSSGATTRSRGTKFHRPRRNSVLSTINTTKGINTSAAKNWDRRYPKYISNVRSQIYVTSIIVFAAIVQLHLLNLGASIPLTCKILGIPCLQHCHTIMQGLRRRSSGQIPNPSTGYRTQN